MPHEPAAFDARRVVFTGIGMLAVVAVLSAILLVVIGHPHSAQRSAEFTGDGGVPQPRLQANPVDDYTSYRDEKQAMLSGYGWIDRNAGTAHIPIDRAMDIVAARQKSPTETRP